MQRPEAAVIYFFLNGNISSAVECHDINVCLRWEMYSFWPV